MNLDHPFAALLVGAGSGLPWGPIFAAAGLFLALFAVVLICFALIQRKIQRLAWQAKRREKDTTSLAGELEAQALLVRQMSIDLEELRKRLSDDSAPVQPVAPLWPSPEVPVHLNRRGQIIRLARKGKSVAEIAHDLRVAKGEVELLLKLHDLSQGEFEMEKS